MPLGVQALLAMMSLGHEHTLAGELVAHTASGVGTMRCPDARQRATERRPGRWSHWPVVYSPARSCPRRPSGAAQGGSVKTRTPAAGMVHLVQHWQGQAMEALLAGLRAKWRYRPVRRDPIMDRPLSNPTREGRGERCSGEIRQPIGNGWRHVAGRHRLRRRRRAWTAGKKADRGAAAVTLEFQRAKAHVDSLLLRVAQDSGEPLDRLCLMTTSLTRIVLLVTGHHLHARGE